MKKIGLVALRYGAPVAVFAAILFLLVFIQRTFGVKVDLTALIILLMIATAWYVGRGPGLLVAFVFEATIDYYTPSRPILTIINRLVLFSAVVLFASSRRFAEKRLRDAESELQRLLKSERLAREEAETADRLKDEFLATVSHELRTPLSAILGWAAMLNMGNLDETTARHGAEIIERNARAQSEIIRDILDVSRIIKGKLRIEAKPVTFAQVITAAADTLKLAANAKGILLEIDIQSQDAYVTGDRDRLQQMMWNLIANAIKFTPKDGAIKVEMAKVDESYVEVKVRDNGIGISYEFLPHVFERFRQADSSTTRVHGGLGLGLAIVRHLVEIHGGVVSVQSDGEDKGAEFVVRLPLSAAPQKLETDVKFSSTVAVPEIKTPSGEFPTLGGLRVLIVDDEPDSREVLTVILSRYGAKVKSTSSSKDALTTVAEWQPHVLLSDLGMPEEDGYTLISQIRALGPARGGDIPAAALTAHVREEDRRRAIDAGYQAHISKPVDPLTLMNTVANLSGKSSNNR